MGCRREKWMLRRNDDHMKSGRKSGVTWKDSEVYILETVSTGTLSWINWGMRRRENEINRTHFCLTSALPLALHTQTPSSQWLLIPKFSYPVVETLQSSLFLLFPAHLISSSFAWKCSVIHPLLHIPSANCVVQTNIMSPWLSFTAS